MTVLSELADRIRSATDEAELEAVYCELVRRVGPGRAMTAWPSRNNYDMRPMNTTAVAAAVESIALPPFPAQVAVTLEDHEIIYAQTVAAMRHTQDLRAKKIPRFGDPNKMLWFNTIGCFGELAVAKHLGLYWNGALGDYDAADVGRFQVRTSSGDNSLSVYHWDKGDWFVAVVGVAPKLRIIGCFERRHAQVPEFEARDHGMAVHKVPQHRLWPLSDLPIKEARHAAP